MQAEKRVAVELRLLRDRGEGGPPLAFGRHDVRVMRRSQTVASVIGAPFGATLFLTKFGHT